VNEILPIAGRMVLDLSVVEFVDGGGLGEFVLLQMWADAAGYTLKFSGASRSVRQELELSNLASVLDLEPSVSDALVGMGGGRPQAV